MYLHEKRNDSILTYELKEKEEASKEYRKQNLEVYKAIDRYGLLRLKFIENIEFFTPDSIVMPGYENVLTGELCMNGDAIYHSPINIVDFVPETDNDIIKATLDEYHDGKYKNKSIAVIKTKTGQHTVLLITNEYKKQKSRMLQNKDEYVMSGIIKLTPDLFILQMLEQEDFSIINNLDMDISSPLHVFDFNPNPINSIEISAIEQANHTNLINVDLEEMMNKVEESSKTLQKVKLINHIK